MKKSRLLALGLSAALAVSLLAGCSNTTEQSSGFNLNLCFASEPETMDPTLNRTVDGNVMMNHLFEGLYKYVDSDPSGDGRNGATAVLVPGQAAEEPAVTENADGTYTYTFTLRDDIYWSDGEPVTANDFVYSWQRLVDPETASPYNTIIAMVVNANEIINGEKDKSELGVKAVDDKTFEVQLTYNCSYFLDICAFPNTMPLREDVVEGNSTWSQDPSTYVCNGPYKMASWTHDAEIVMAQNEKYYNVEELGPDTLTFKLMDDANAQLTAFNNGDLDYMQNPPTDETASLLVAGTLLPGDYLGTYYCCFNNQKAPFDDVNVRRAFSLAIDRNYIVQQVTQSGEVPAGGWVPSNVVDAQGTDGDDFRTVGGDYIDVNDYEANCELARQLLAEAGYPNGEGFPEVTYLYNTDERHGAIAEALQSMWKEVLGVQVRLDNQDWNVFLETRSKGEYSMCRNGWIADYNDPVSFLDMFMTSNGNNDAHYSNSEYDAIMTEVLSDSDAEGRMALMHQAEDLLMEQDCAIAPLYYYSNPYMISDNVHGMYYSPLGAFIFSYCTQP
ncbi:peptide ABC transporter substrate-binding protein [Pseudoflavonifractor phocaeensis]|uniref:peptide ABC transporter substrate-binding protein n=1 Tax=Pseudoflavonifractor phocaeensis TaxID=1870988 RepID=UPI001959A492|nr:peptide ABC transporter substrate-binding protein [Pseudoflavonifractor phocaeensis]MBM6869821.1 peptide ABC transporter substrate-binding protein [Pseudoflavonifractor phocaeensis]